MKPDSMHRSPLPRVCLTAVLCLGLAACGGNSPTSPTSSAPVAPPAPVSTVLTQGSFSGLGVNEGFWSPSFTTTTTGRLDVTVDWTYSACDLDLYVVRGTQLACSLEQFNSHQCDMVSFSESLTAKPEKISVASLPAGTYTLIIANWGPREEAFSYQAVLTTGGSASSAMASTVRPSRAGALRAAAR